MSENKQDTLESKLIHSLTDNLKQLNAGSGHACMFNIRHTKNLTAVVSVYDGEKPAHMVLDELTEWAEKNDPVLLKRIEELIDDMSWNDGHSV